MNKIDNPVSLLSDIERSFIIDSLRIRGNITTLSKKDEKIKQICIYKIYGVETNNEQHG